MLGRFFLAITSALISFLIIMACNNHDASDEPLLQEDTRSISSSPLNQSSPIPIQASQTALPVTNSIGTGSVESPFDSVTDELTTVEVVKILAPSVVQIVTEVLSMGFFNQPAPSRGVGTGVILDDLGHILTNNHVIAGAQSISVTLSNGEIYPASLVGHDLNTDLAVIHIQGGVLIPAVLGSVASLEVGQGVIAIGHALGLNGGPTVSKGVVSALGRSIDSGQGNTIVDLIQTDASINPGNSGGSLANTRAEVIGINTAIIQGTQGIGFAINIDDAKVVATQLIEQGFVRRGYLGIGPTNVNPGLADQFGLPVTKGILVARVLPNTPASEAGLKEEDVIIQLGEQDINNTGELSKFLIDHLPGETVALVYFRGHKKISTNITLGQRPVQ